MGISISNNRSTRAPVDHRPSDEDGQSIVLIVLVFIGLLAFTALAVDAGFAFVRSSQFSSAVDSATLAGVVDLDPAAPITDTLKADIRAEQFLAANGWPTDTISLFDSSRSTNFQGYPEYSLTVTWPVDLFFISVIGIDGLDITHHATAAFYAQAELFTATAYDSGHLRKASQFISGRNACTMLGDPVSPLLSSPGPPSTPNEFYTLFEGTYRYRILVPETYTDVVRIELFDPDSVNRDGNNATVFHTPSVSSTLGISETLTCGDPTVIGMGDRCVIETGESLTSPRQNPFWFQRVDQTMNASCSSDFGNPNGDNITTFELYYFDANGTRTSLATYTGPTDSGVAVDTDIQWVTPGVSSGVPADSGSFQVDPSGLPANESGDKFIYLDVASSGGTSKNVWDIWAGPLPTYYTSQGLGAPSRNVNLRNLQIASSPSLYDTQGITVFALGRLPTETYFNNDELTLPLAPLDISSGGGSIYAKVFDYDSGGLTPPPLINFTIDTVAQDEFYIDAPIVDPPDPSNFEAVCNSGTDCNNSWTFPQFAMGIPGEGDTLSRFFGGTLEANYTPLGNSHTWSVAITSGRPFLTR